MSGSLGACVRRNVSVLTPQTGELLHGSGKETLFGTTVPYIESPVSFLVIVEADQFLYTHEAYFSHEVGTPNGFVDVRLWRSNLVWQACCKESLYDSLCHPAKISCKQGVDTLNAAEFGT